jgi:hypothetical protein
VVDFDEQSLTLEQKAAQRHRRRSHGAARADEACADGADALGQVNEVTSDLPDIDGRGQLF